MTASEKEKITKAVKNLVEVIQAQEKQIKAQGQQIDILLETLLNGVEERKKLARRVSTLEAQMKDALSSAGQALLATDALGRQSWVH